MKINRHYLELEDSYLFSTISRRVGEYLAEHPGADLIRMGIGDVTLPLCPAVTDAMHAAVGELGHAESFRGYGPEQGYDFLGDAVRSYYARRGVSLERGEVFVSDGAKSDIANILDILGTENTVLIPDPVYPVYLDTNIMAGRPVEFMRGDPSNGFLPLPDDRVQADIIYLCSPNNPTGAVYSAAQLEEWVDYANRRGALILFDAAYEAFVRDDALPRSIYEIPGAKTCAIEFCSLSKTAGFTGTRCGYTVVPQTLERDGARLGGLWLRRQATRFNGVPYIVQRGAAAVFTDEGLRQTGTNIDYYLQNAQTIADTLRDKDIWFVGGDNSPYIWLRCPGGMDSWRFFDHLLEQAGVVGTPGAGFGPGGEGFFRLTAFGDRERTREAMARIAALL